MNERYSSGKAMSGYEEIDEEIITKKTVNDRYNSKNPTSGYEDIDDKMNLLDNDEDDNRYEGNKEGNDERNQYFGNESPQIVATSKTLMLQSRVLGTRGSEYGFQ